MERIRADELYRGYSLIDSEAQHRAHPETWETPAAEWLDRIGSAWWVKIGVDHPSQPGERFWCRVEGVAADGIHLKVAQPDLWLSDLHDVWDGDPLTVQRRHILDLQPPADGDVVWDDEDSWTVLHDQGRDYAGDDNDNSTKTEQ